MTRSHWPSCHSIYSMAVHVEY